MKNEHTTDLVPVKSEEFLPLLRESLKPLNMCLGVLIRTGSSDLMVDVCRVVSELMITACKEFQTFNQHEGSLH
jgi:hypothetical protein